MTLRAGIGRRMLAPPLGGAMMGYGARRGVAEDHNDPLLARALYLESGSSLLLVELDVCLLSLPQATEARERIARRTGVPASRVMLGCVHTHSGPDTGFGAWLAGAPVSEEARRIVDVAVEVACAAQRAAAPARLGVGRAQANIGRNRRRAGASADPEVLLVRIDGRDGAPRAVLYVYGCHPTVLGHENLAYSADWPGYASRFIESEMPGAMAMFALGAHADVDPRTRGLLDVAIPDQSFGAGSGAAEVLGAEVGRAVAKAALDVSTRDDAPVAAAASELEVPVHGGDVEAVRADALEASRLRAAAALELDPEARRGVSEWFAAVHQRTAALPREEARRRIAVARAYLRDRTAPRFAGGLRPRVPVQVLRLGDAWLLGLPGEATVAVGRDWRVRLGGRAGAVVSIANGWIRYLPHASDFADAGSEAAYEILMSTLVPDAAQHLLEAGEALRAEIETTG